MITENKFPIRLVGLDLDGTLLNEKFELNPTVVDAFKRARQAGIQVIVVTGRDLNSALPFLRRLEADKTVITSGGAQIWLDGSLIRQTSFTRGQTRKLLSIGVEFGAGLYVDQPSHSWRFGARYYTDMYNHVSDSVEIKDARVLLEPPPFKISIIQEPSILEQIRARLSVRYPGFTLTAPFPQVLDVNPVGCNKGAALEYLARRMGIDLGQIAVVGDSENDLSMFTISSHTYAMGNAAPVLRNLAKVQAPANKDDGAAWVLDKILRDQNI
jgi:Cof subfamily protein (haloacid dehalogenase superfamily)